MRISKMTDYDFNLTINEMYKNELTELLNIVNSKDRKELIQKQIDRRIN